MDVPWGWMLVALWLAGGVGGFIVFLQRFESAFAIWYYLVGEEGFRPFRTLSQALPLVVGLVFCLALGPVALLVEVQSRRTMKQKMQRMERLRERRRQRRATALAPAPGNRIDHAGS